ncbi:MAG: GldG family protein [bacterium]|nr:GldG family protein [bacterium]
MKDFKKNFITTFVIGAVLLAAIVIAINMVFSNFNFGRFDLTANNIYKLSPSVGKILSDLEAPIDMTYYVSSSEKMPTQWKDLERDVIDKLEELKLASKGKLNYTVFDPSAEEEKEAFEEIKDKEAEKKGDEKDFIKEDQKSGLTRKKIAERLYERGVIPFGVQSTERDELSVKRVYSSIVLSYLDRREDVIEEVRPETFGNLEYEIMSRIYKLISNKRPKIAFYPGQPKIQQQYRQFYQQQAPPDFYSFAEKMLQESGYDVTRTNIEQNDPIPAGIQTMLVMIDQPLNERQMYEIDKLVHNGVRVVMAAQMYNFQITPSRSEPGQFDLMGMPSRLNTINGLAKNYGFEFDDKIFMDKSTAFIQVPVYQTRRMGMFQIQEQRYEPVTKPVIIKVNAENINSDLSISNKISELYYMYGGRLLVNKDAMKENNLQFRTLFTSSNFSWIREGMGYGNIDVTPPASEDVLKNQPLGILVEGKFKSQYVDQEIPKWSGETSPEDEQADSLSRQSEITGDPRENKIIAFGSSNIFKNDILQAVNSHKALLLNSVDALTLGDELINIRSKNIAARRIKATSGMGKALAKTFVVWFPPVVFIALGIFITLKRKKKV